MSRGVESSSRFPQASAAASQGSIHYCVQVHQIFCSALIFHSIEIITMKYAIKTVVVANLVAASAAHTASASVAEHATEQRKLWGSGTYKWTPKEPEECYDVRALCCFCLLFVSFSSARS